MSDLSVAAREGARLARSAPIRTAVVATTIGGATALGMVSTSHGSALAIACWALAFSTLVVARRSPRPERLASAAAWSRAGAGRSAIWMSGVFEALLLGWGAALVGAAIGAALSQAIDPSSSFRPGTHFLVWQLGGLALSAFLPTSRERGAHLSRTRRSVRRVGVAIRVGVVFLALVATFEAARTIRTDTDLAFAGLTIISLLVAIGVIVTGAASRWIVGGLGSLPGCRAVAAIAARYRAPATVRIVLVASVTVATAAAILGASVEARPETNRVLAQRLSRLPVLPRNVALIRLDPTGLAALDPNASPALSQSDAKKLRAAITRAVPSAQIIELRDVGAVASKFFCEGCNSGPLVVAEARLRSIYGDDAKYPPERGVDSRFLTTAPQQLQVGSFTRVPPRDALALDVLEGKPLPPARFTGAVYYEVPQATVDSLHIETKVRSVFLRSSAPLTPVELTRLMAVARTVHAAPNAQVALIGPSGQLLPTRTRPAPVAIGQTALREAPWAATSTGSRWSMAAIAILIALATLLVTLAIDTLDRRRDVQRLERLGATPRQVRAAAAAHAAALLVISTWLSAALVYALVRTGTTSFNHAEPSIPVPLTMPWPVVLLLTVGLPIIGAGLAALVARPTWLQTRPVWIPAASPGHV